MAITRMADSYIDGKKQIIKNAFKSNVVEFMDAENKIIFKYPISEIEIMIISLYLRALFPDGCSENSNSSLNVFKCTLESFTKLKDIYDSMEKITCPICANPGII